MRLELATLVPTVLGVLSDIKIEILGPNFASSSDSAISVSFVPGTRAIALIITAVYPPNFDFLNSRVYPGDDYTIVDSLTYGNQIAITNVAIEPTETTQVRIDNVRLGSNGGSTRFTIRTYSATDFITANIVESEINFRDGFRLPGLLTVNNQTLISRFASEPGNFPVESTLPPKSDDSAMALFSFKVSQIVKAGAVLTVQSSGVGAYSILDTSVSLARGSEAIDFTASLNTTSNTLSLTLLPAVIDPTVTAFDIGVNYAVSLAVTPNVGASLWRFEVSDGAVLALNTNDGTLAGFAGASAPVVGLKVTMTMGFTPPNVFMRPTFAVSAIPFGSTKLRVIVPQGYKVSDPCGQFCQFRGVYRDTAQQQGLIIALSELYMEVLSPKADPAAVTWYFILEKDDGTILGWGSTVGFRLQEMQGISLFYPSVSQATATKAVIQFTVGTSTNIDSIEVMPPSGMLLRCSTANFDPLYVPGAFCVGDSLRTTGMIVGFTEPLTAGDYTFIVGTDLPKSTPAINLFDFTGRLNQVVVDGRYGVTGLAIQNTYRVSRPMLYWSSAATDAEATVTLGFYLDLASTQISAILLVFPADFSHNIQSPLQVKSMNRAFPYNPDFWVDFNRTNIVKILVDDTVVTVNDKRIDMRYMDASLYRFTFPVIVPRTIPAYNVWYVVICSDRECSTKTDDSAKVMLPIGGFEADEACLTCPVPLSQLVESLASRSVVDFMHLMIPLLLINLM